MARPWKTRIAELFKNAKQPAKAAAKAPMLKMDMLEDRVVPATYFFSNANSQLLITLAGNETLAVASAAANANVTFTLTNGTFTQGQNSDVIAGANGNTTFTLTQAQVAAALAINNDPANAANVVNFTGGAGDTLTSNRIVVNLTDAAGSGADNIQLNGLLLTGAGVNPSVALSTQNGSVISPAAGNDIMGASSVLLSASAGVGSSTGNAIEVTAPAAGTTLAARTTTGGGVRVTNLGANLLTIGAPDPVAAAVVVGANTIANTTVTVPAGVSSAGGNVSVTSGAGGLTAVSTVSNAGTAANAGDVTLTSGGTTLVNAPASTATGVLTLGSTGLLNIGANGAISSSQGGTINIGTAATTTDITIGGTVMAMAGSGMGDAVVIRNTGNTTVNNAVSVAGSTRGVSAVSTGANSVFSTGTVAGVNGGVTVAGGRVSVVASDIALNAGAITTGGTTAGVVTLNPLGNNAITLGAAGAAGTFGLIDADIDRITASVLRLGSDTYTGNITIGGAAGAVTVDAARVPTVQLVTTGAGTIVDAAAGGTAPDLAVQNLSLRAASVGTAASSIDIDARNLAVANVAGQAGGVFINGAGDLTIANVVGDQGLPAGFRDVSGIVTTGSTAGTGVIAVGTTGTLSVAAMTNVTANDAQNVSLVAGNNAQIGGTVATSGAGVTRLAVDQLFVDNAGANFIGATDTADPVGGTLTLATGAALNSGQMVMITGGTQADTFSVAPQNAGTGGAVLNVNGNDPTTAPGDVLNVDLTGTTQTGITNTGPTAATVTYGNNRQNIAFTSIETPNLNAGPPAPPVVVMASVAATDGNAQEPAGMAVATDTGTFTFTLSTAAPAGGLTVNYVVSGTATSGGDFTPIGTSVNIPAGATTATVTVTPLGDAATEPNETVIVTLAPGSGYSLATPAPTATVTILDVTATPPAAATIVATDPSGQEPTGMAAATDTITFTVSLAAAAPAGGTVVNYTISGTATNGTDYTVLPGTVTIPAGATSATITVTPLGDAATEVPPETVIITLAPGAGYTLATPAPSATAQILDVTAVLPTATITATDPTAAETVAGAPADTGTFTVTLSSAQATATTINVTLSGTATSGADFAAITLPVVIAAGATTATFTVTPIDDTVQEPSETVIATLAAGSGYTIATPAPSATVTIADNDTPVVPPVVPPVSPPVVPPAPSATGVQFTPGGTTATVARASGGNITFVAPPGSVITGAMTTPDFNGNGTADYMVNLTIAGIGAVTVFVEASNNALYGAIGDFNADARADVVLQIPSFSASQGVTGPAQATAVFFFDGGTGRLTRIS